MGKTKDDYLDIQDIYSPSPMRDGDYIPNEQETLVIQIINQKNIQYEQEETQRNREN